MRAGSSQFACTGHGILSCYGGYPATCLSHSAGRVAPSLPTPSFEEVLLTAVAPPALDRELETEAINALRVLSIDAVQAANSGHPGLPLGRGCRWPTSSSTEFMKLNPQNPEWPDRDRFVLSAGHGSALLYSLLYLTGYDLPLDELKNFRQLGSKTPGHPERGIPRASKSRPARSVRDSPTASAWRSPSAFWPPPTTAPVTTIIDHYTYGIVSDGDLMEGVAVRGGLPGRASRARQADLPLRPEPHHPGRHRRASPSPRMSPARFEAVGWHVQRDRRHGHRRRPHGASQRRRAETDTPVADLRPDHHRLRLTEEAKAPSASTARRSVPTRSSQPRGTSAGPRSPPSTCPTTALAALPQGGRKAARKRQGDWEQALRTPMKRPIPSWPPTLTRAWTASLPDGWDSRSARTGRRRQSRSRPARPPERSSRPSSPKVPTFIGGSADLNPSTNTGMKGAGDFEPAVPAAERSSPGLARRRLGLRRAQHPLRHPRARHGQRRQRHGRPRRRRSPSARPSSSSPITCARRFASPRSPSCKSIFVFTHDSIAVGEDGPTHEPVEQLCQPARHPEAASSSGPRTPMKPRTPGGSR